MATHFGGYYSTSNTYNHESYGISGDWTSVYYRFSIALTVGTDGTISYTITVASNVNETFNWSNGGSCSMWIAINDEEILAAKYYGGNINGFPTKPGSTKSGTLKSKASGSTVSIKTKILPGSDYTGWSAAWNSSLDTSTLTRSSWSWTDVGTGTTTITDNFNNSFTITATKGANGTNNTAGGPTNLKWGYTTAKSNTYTSGQTIALTRETPSNATRTVYAESTTTATYGDAKIATASKAINQYYDPGDPGVPVLTDSSFKNGRLTVKQNWQYLWTPAQKRGCSDVKGYRIRVYKNSSPITGLTYNSSSNTLGLGTGTNEFVDTESTNSSITFNPVTLGFNPKDTVLLRIHAYSKNAHGQQEWKVGSTTYRLFSAAKDSVATTVQNAGIVRVKVGNEWKEGQVWVKTSDGWKEAETVNVKTSAGWKESQ